MPRQRIRRTNPQRLELLGFVGHRGLRGGHARDQEGHVEAARQVAVGDPVRQHEHLVGRQLQALGAALGKKVAMAVQCRDVGVGHGAAVGVARQQNAQFLEALADRGNRLRQAQIVLADAACRQRVRGGISGVNAATWKDIGTGRKAGVLRAARHQHFDAIGAITQQQHRGGGARHGTGARGMQELIRSDHGLNYGQVAEWQGQPG